MLCWSSKPDILGAHLSSTCAWHRTQNLGFSGKSPIFVRSLPVMDHGAGGTVLARLCLSLSYPSQCGLFILSCGGACSSFQVFFRGNCSICSYRFGVSMGGGDSGSSYTTILTGSSLVTRSTWAKRCLRPLKNPSVNKYLLRSWYYDS